MSKKDVEINKDDIKEIEKRIFYISAVWGGLGFILGALFRFI